MAEIFISKELRFYFEYDWQSTVLRRAIFEKPIPSFSVTFIKEHENSSITLTIPLQEIFHFSISS
jgi:hypothetical protein